MKPYTKFEQAIVCCLCNYVPIDFAYDLQMQHKHIRTDYLSVKKIIRTHSQRCRDFRASEYVVWSNIFLDSLTMIYIYT